MLRHSDDNPPRARKKQTEVFGKKESATDGRFQLRSEGHTRRSVAVGRGVRTAAFLHPVEMSGGFGLGFGVGKGTFPYFLDAPYMVLCIRTKFLEFRRDARMHFVSPPSSARV